MSDFKVYTLEKQMYLNLKDDNLCFQKTKIDFGFLLNSPPPIIWKCEELQEKYKYKKSFNWVTEIWNWECKANFSSEERFPPMLKKCKFWESAFPNYSNCCPNDEFDLLMLQRFLEKKKESWKLEEFKDYYISLTKVERQEITQEIIKQEEMYSMVTRDFKIISQEEYNHLKMNWEIKEQTGIFMFIFFLLLIFLKSFRKYFLKKG